MGRAKWKYEAGRTVLHSCRKKLRHEHFMSALRHAIQIQHLRPSVFYTIYYCEHCEGAHVGRGITMGKLNSQLKHLKKIQRTPGFIAKAPPEIKDKFNRQKVDVMNQIEILRSRISGNAQ